MPKSRAASARPKRPAPPPISARSQASPFIWAGLAAVAAIVLAGAWYFWPANSFVAPTEATPSGPRIVTQVESLYNDITVYEQEDGNLVLSFGAKRLHYIESIVNPKDELDLPVTYARSMTAGLAYAAGLDDAMIIGLGGGRTAWYHHKSVPGLHMTAVELDPEVVRLADQYFNVRPEPGFDIVVNDGRVWLTGADKKFDIILVDAYRGRFVPFHLLTSEFYKLVAAHLKPGGVAVQNVEPSTMLFDSAVATIHSAFEHLVFFQGDGNIVILAYNGPEKDEAWLKATIAERQAKYNFRYDLNKILENRFDAPIKADVAPLTDDFAPVEYLKAIARHNVKQRPAE